jgi:hypothetical protein
MNVAVGRLHLSITMASPVPETQRSKERSERDGLEHAFRAERLHQDVESDRRRWASNHTLRNFMR